VAKLVEILLQGLSADDFARVRDIVLGEDVLSDSLWTQQLQAAFIDVTRNRLQLHRAGRSDPGSESGKDYKGSKTFDQYRLASA
jgi:hypothetical protein